MKVARASEYPINGSETASPAERRKYSRSAVVALDDLDRGILAELAGNARIRTAELGRRVNLSAPATSERLRRLEDSGVVSYRADVSPWALGYSICAIIRVSPATRDLHRIPETAQDTPEVTECYRITGEDCYFMTVYLRAIDDLEAVIDRFTPYGRTTTSIVHSAPVPRRALPLAQAPSS